MPRGTHLTALKRLVGTVVSVGMVRTVVVAVPRLKLHKKTRRFLNHTTRYFCHDHHRVCGLGDKVEIKYCGRVSLKKHWSVIDILHRRPRLEGEPFPMAVLQFNPFTGERMAGAVAATAADAAAAAVANPTPEALRQKLE